MSAPQQLLNFLNIGGPVVWIHLFMSVALVTILLAKLWQFSSAGLFSASRRSRAERVVDHWQSNAQQEAVDEALRGKDPENRLLYNLTTHLSQGTLKGKALHDELARQATLTLGQLRSQLKTLELIASLAPLLGLLGTVLGMIEAFQAMELAGNQVDPSTLSGGIWKALLTTAVGLVVAVPAIVIHNWLDRRVEGYADGLSDRVARILTVSNLATLKQAQPSLPEITRASA